MNWRQSLKAAALVVTSGVLMGGTCSDEKIVELILGFPTTVRVIAEGSINDKGEAADVSAQQAIDLKTELDIEGALEDADIDISSLEVGDIRVAQVQVRVVEPDQVANRMIESGSLTVVRLDSSGNPLAAPDILITNWSMPAGSGNSDGEWIDLTDVIGADGIALLNIYIDDCIRFLRDSTPFSNPGIRYDWSGLSTPGDQETLFQYEIRVIFQGKFEEEFDIPFG